MGEPDLIIEGGTPDVASADASGAGQDWVARRFLSPGQQPIYLDGRRKLEYP
jgi:hypothetical protein